MEEDFDIRGNIAPIEENIKKNYFICKEICDKYSAKTKMEEKRLKSVKIMPGTEKKNEPEIEFKTIYIPYFYLEGNYSIIYLRRKKYEIPIDQNVQAIKIHDSIINLEGTFRVKPDIVNLDVIEKVKSENKGELTADKDMNLIQKKDIPFYNELDEKTYYEYESNNEIEKLKYPFEYFIEKLKEKILNRPSDAIRTLSEVLNVEINIILRPTYEGIFEYKGQIKKMMVDGVTGKSKFI